MKTVWKSELTADMVSELDQDTLDSLIDELNDAVAAICSDWGL